MPAEALGWLPSLVYTPMMIEDGRRLIVSNLNLQFISRNVGGLLVEPESKKVTADEDDQSVGARQRPLLAIVAGVLRPVPGRVGLQDLDGDPDECLVPVRLAGGEPADEPASPGCRRRLLRQLWGEPVVPLAGRSIPLADPEHLGRRGHPDP